MIRHLQDSHTAHRVPAVLVMAAVPAKTAHKPPINNADGSLCAGIWPVILTQRIGQRRRAWGQFCASTSCQLSLRLEIRAVSQREGLRSEPSAPLSAPRTLKGQQLRSRRLSFAKMNLRPGERVRCPVSRGR
jgi:hypothetical protein